MLCFGPFCLPVWQLGVFIALLLGPLKAIIFSIYEWACSRGRRTHASQSEAVSPSMLLLHRGAGGGVVYDEVKRRVLQEEFPVLHFRSDKEVEDFWGKADNDCKVFADFSAQWCGPCKAVAPFYELLSAGYEGVFLSIDIDDCPHTAEMAGITMLPTLALLEKKTAALAGPADPQWGVAASTSGANARTWEQFVAGHSISRKSSSKQ